MEGLSTYHFSNETNLLTVRLPCFPHEGRVPHISLVLREMWDTTNVDRSMHRTDRESEGRAADPNLAPLP